MIWFYSFVERPKSKNLNIYLKGMYPLFGQFLDILYLYGLMMALIETRYWKETDYVISFRNDVDVPLPKSAAFGGGPMHVIFITCMGYPFSLPKKLMILKVLAHPMLSIHHAKYN